MVAALPPEEPSATGKYQDTYQELYIAVLKKSELLNSPVGDMLSVVISEATV